MQQYLVPLLASALCGFATWLLLGKASRRVAVAGTLLAAIGVGIVVWWAGQPGDRSGAPPSPAVSQSTPRVPTGSALAQLETRRPVEVPADGYVSSQVCRECHPDNHATWSASYHRTMTQVATPAAVLGDFNDRQVTARGRTYRLRQRSDVCAVEMDNPDLPVGQAPRIEVPIVMTTGSHHMQVYWYATGHGRLLGQLPLVFLKEAQRWIPREAAFLVPPSVAVSSETGRWNETCIGCHATHGRPRPNVGGQWDTQVAEFGISCEACHGPGGRHVAEHRDRLATAGPQPAPLGGDSMVNPARLTHRRSSEVCGHCHSVNTSFDPDDFRDVLAGGYRYRPGQVLAESRFVVQDNAAGRRHLARYLGDADPLDDHSPTAPRPAGAGSADSAAEERVAAYLRDRFWADGMTRVSGREYNGLLESACFQEGTLSCLTCHAMHQEEDDPRTTAQWADDQLRHDATGDAACLSCHTGSQYNETHTHHSDSSAGARCYNCHMPHTTYGLLKAIRSHQISSPHVGRDLRAGRPNACNLCHLDQTLAWSAQHLEQWYGTPRPTLDEDQTTVAASLLWLLRGDAGQRALAAWSMGWEPAQQASGQEWLAPFLALLLEDPYDAVRYMATRSLRTLPGFATFSGDFLGSAEQRRAARERVWQTWRQRGLSETGPGRLIDPQRRLQREPLDRLLRQRDERPVNLVE